LTSSVVLPLVSSWRNVFFVYGLFGFTVVLIWLTFGGRKPQLSKDDGASLMDTKPAEPSREVFRSRNLWLTVIMGVIFFQTTHGLQNWMPKILELRGHSIVASGYATSLLTLAGILVSSCHDSCAAQEAGGH